MADVFRFAWLRLSAVAMLLVGLFLLQDPHSARAQETAGCASNGPIAFLCGLRNLEDMAQIPDRPLVIGASYGASVGGESMVVIDAEHRSFAPLPITLQTRPRRPYGDCPGPLDMTRFSPHGIAIRPGRRDQHTLYVVNHGGRESVEVFALGARGGRVGAQWIGCVVLPEGASGNAVAPLSDGGFLVTKFFDTREGPSRPQFLARRATSAIYRWRPGVGFDLLGGSEAVSDNGVDVSPDERWVYFTSWVDNTLTRLPSSGEGEATTIHLDFMPDNIRATPDGTLLVTGQATTIELIAACKHARCPLDWAVARVDPETMETTYLYWEKGTPEFGGATTALQVGGDLWIGTFRGDRVAIVDATPNPSQ
jgi:hypothetical protein